MTLAPWSSGWTARLRGRIGETGRLHWRALSRGGRLATAGVVVSAALAVALGVLIPRVTHDHTLGARLDAIGSMVLGLERAGVIPSVDEHLSGEAYASFDAVVRDGLLGGENIRVKLWSTQGEVVYSDEPAQVGERHPAPPDLAAALAGQPRASHTRLDEPENMLDRSIASEAIEFYVPLHGPDGAVIGAFEIYQDSEPLLAHWSTLRRFVWLAVGTGLSILLTFLILLFGATARAIGREKRAAEDRAEDLGVLLGTAELLSSGPALHETAPRVLRRASSRLDLLRAAVLLDGPDPDFSWTPTGEDRTCEAVVRSAREARRLGRNVGRSGRCEVTNRRCTALAVPIHVEPDRSGALAVCREADRAFGPREIALLNGVAGQLAVAAESATLIADLKRTTQVRGELLRQLVRAQEDERRHIVGDFHDQAGQMLTRVLYGLRGSRIRLGRTSLEVSEELGRLEHLVDELIADLRRYMMNVRPEMLDDFGLPQALEAFAREQEMESGLRVEVRADQLPELEPATAITLFRAAQEAVMNARKHADPESVRIDVDQRAGSIALTVADDGSGAAELRDGVGLTYLRNRVASLGGSVNVATRMGVGTTVTVEIPRSQGA